MEFLAAFGLMVMLFMPIIHSLLSIFALDFMWRSKVFFAKLSGIKEESLERTPAWERTTRAVGCFSLIGYSIIFIWFANGLWRN